MSLSRLVNSAAAALMLACIVAAPAAQAQQPAAAGAPSPADSALATRFVELAQAVLAAQTPDQVTFERAIALLEGARRLHPTEARHLRLLADALIRTHDSAALLDVITAYRKLPGRVEDRVAQLEYIDLLLNRYETVDQRLEFLRDLIGREAVAKEIRSELAMRTAGLYGQKKQGEEEQRAIEQALALEPTNLNALRAKWVRTFEAATPAQRLEMALAMVKSNPRQTQVIAGVASNLAQVGLVKESLAWYGHLFTASARQGIPVPPEVATGAAAQLFLSARPNEARGILDRLDANGHGGYPTAVLRVLLDRHEGNKEAAEKSLGASRNTLINQLQTARAALGVQGATTQPIQGPRQAIPELGGDVALLKDSTKPEVKGAYLQAVGDLAWFEVFFSADAPGASKLIAILSAGQDPNDKDSTAFLTRLQGWIALRQSEAGIAERAQEATTKLTAVAERDPLAELGLIKLLATTDREQARTRSHQLLSKHPHGIVGALLVSSLRDAGLITPAEGSLLPAAVAHPDAKALGDELAKFPADFMRILDAPQTFYTLRIEPVKVIVGFGEPLMVRVTLQNNSQYDLTIGEDGVIRPELWLDAMVSIGAAEPRALPNVGVDRITDHIVLRPRQSISRLIRVDRSDLSGMLFLNPTPPILFRVTVKTNPIPTPSGAIPSAGGYASVMTRPMERSGTPLNEQVIQRVSEAAVTGQGIERIRALELIASISSLHRRANQAAIVAKAEPLMEPVRKSRSDDSASLRAWSGFLVVAYGAEEGRAGEVEKMLADPAWQVRLMGLLMVRALPENRMKPAVAEIANNDADALVKRSAVATLEYLNRPPATQPAGAATQPAGDAPQPALPVQP